MSSMAQIDSELLTDDEVMVNNFVQVVNKVLSFSQDPDPQVTASVTDATGQLSTERKF